VERPATWDLFTGGNADTTRLIDAHARGDRVTVGVRLSRGGAYDMAKIRFVTVDTTGL
jgi:hypothetical protein